MRPTILRQGVHACYLSLIALTLGATLACTPANQQTPNGSTIPSRDIDTMLPTKPEGKPVVYQVFTRH